MSLRGLMPSIYSFAKKLRVSPLFGVQKRCTQAKVDLRIASYNKSAGHLDVVSAEAAGIPYGFFF